MFFTVVAAILGTVYYTYKIIHSRNQSSRARKREAAQIEARVNCDRVFAALHADEAGSEEFRGRFPMDYEFSKRVCEEGAEILRGIPDLKTDIRPHMVGGCDTGNYHLAAFLHFIPTGKVYSWWIIANGPKPFGMPMEEAEKVMHWGVQELKKHGVGAPIYKGWDNYGHVKYGWTIPLGSKTWDVIG